MGFIDSRTGRSSASRCILPAALALAILLSGCGTTGTLQAPDTSGHGSTVRRLLTGIFTHASMSDLQFVGPIVASHDLLLDVGSTVAVAAGAPPKQAEQLKAALTFAVQSGLIEPQGPRVLEIMLAGETAPRYLVCPVALLTDCASIPLNAPVRAYVQPVGVGSFTVWKVRRLSKLAS